MFCRSLQIEQGSRFLQALVLEPSQIFRPSCGLQKSVGTTWLVERFQFKVSPYLKTWLNQMHEKYHVTIVKGVCNKNRPTHILGINQNLVHDCWPDVIWNRLAQLSLSCCETVYCVEKYRHWLQTGNSAKKYDKLYCWKSGLGYSLGWGWPTGRVFHYWIGYWKKYQVAGQVRVG